MGKEMGGRFKREGTYVYLWLIHVDIWQKTTKFCKAIILQLKNKLKKKKNRTGQHTGSKLVKDYNKAVYCHSAYLTSMHRTSYEMSG